MKIAKLFDGPEGVYYEPTSDEIFLLEEKRIKAWIDLATGRMRESPLFTISCSTLKRYKAALKESKTLMRLGEL